MTTSYEAQGIASHEARARGMRREELAKAYVTTMEQLDLLANQTEAVQALRRVSAVAEYFEANCDIVSSSIAKVIRAAINGEKE